MDKKTAGLDDTFKGKMAQKSFTKNPIKGTKYTIAISSAKGGVGKSTLGKIVSKMQGLKFIDTDSNIEKKFSMKISEIFKTRGEDSVVQTLSVNTHTSVLFFSTQGLAYKIKAWKIPEGSSTSKG